MKKDLENLFSSCRKVNFRKKTYFSPFSHNFFKKISKVENIDASKVETKACYPLKASVLLFIKIYLINYLKIFLFPLVQYNLGNNKVWILVIEISKLLKQSFYQPERNANKPVFTFYRMVFGEFPQFHNVTIYNANILGYWFDIKFQYKKFTRLSSHVWKVF